MATYTDAALVENLLKDAIGYGSKPELDDEQIVRMVTLAMPDGEATSLTLQRAAVTAWGWKAGLVSGKYDIKGASGASLTQSQWFTHCLTMANAYKSGALSVDGETVGEGIESDAFGVMQFTHQFLTGGDA